MAFRYDLMYLIILAFVLSLVTAQVMHNTIQYKALSDSDRYIDSITKGTEERFGVRLLAPLTWGSDFMLKTNFLFILVTGYLIYSSTKNWKSTVLALLGFSISLMLYFSLLAQMMVIAISLWLWTKVEAKGIKNNIIYLLAAAFCFATHKYGIVLIALIYLVKRFVREDEAAKLTAIIAYLAAGGLLFTAFFSAPERVSFFYYLILPISLGPFDLVVWFGLFGIILWMLLKCENNTKELAIVAFCLFATCFNYLFVNHLEIDFWRILIFPELIMLIKIGQSNVKSELIRWMPWVLIAIGVQRLIIGLLV